MNLRIPGPTPLPPSVLQAMTKQMINHRGAKFAAIQAEIVQRLKGFFQTENDLFLFTASGTGGMEAAVVNLLSPGDKVLAVSIGLFGDRIAAIAQAFGAEVIKLDFPAGQAADPEVIQERLKADPEIKAVLVTHNETSTGVTNPLAEIAKVVKESQALLVVDAISSIGAIELPVDEWGCDVVVSGSQKSWMIPPGLVFVGVSPQAWQAHAMAKMPRFYWDFTAMKRYQEQGQTPFTPAVSLCYALRESLRLIAEEGLPNVIARHQSIGERTRAGIKALGLELFADEAYASNTVTAVRMPSDIDGDELRAIMRDEYQVVTAGGFADLKGRIVRIGHLGYVSEADIDDVLQAMGKALAKLRNQ